MDDYIEAVNRDVWRARCSNCTCVLQCEWVDERMQPVGRTAHFVNNCSQQEHRAPPSAPATPLLNVPPTRTRVRIYVTFGMENEVKKWRFAMSWINEQSSLMVHPQSSILPHNWQFLFRPCFLQSFLLRISLLFSLLFHFLPSSFILSVFLHCFPFTAFHLAIFFFPLWLPFHVSLLQLFLLHTTCLSLRYCLVSWLNCSVFDVLVRFRLVSRLRLLSHLPVVCSMP